MAKAATAEVKRYWTLVAAFGCIAVEEGLRCARRAEIAHAHSGSIVERTGEPKAKGRKLPRNNWLVLPLCPYHHRDGGADALDNGVVRWEAKFGRQADHVDRLVTEFGINVWERSQEGRK